MFIIGIKEGRRITLTYVLFAIGLLAAGFALSVAFGRMAEKKWASRLGKVAYGVNGYLLLQGLLGKVHILGNRGLDGYFLFLAAVCACILLISLTVRWIRSKSASTCRMLRFAARTIAVLAAVELLVFNFNSFHLWMGDYTERRLSLTDVTIENGDFVYDAGQDQLTIRGKGEVLLTYQNLDQPVGTLTVDASLANHTKSASVIVDITDETHREYRYNTVNMQLLKDTPRSHFTTCELSGKVGTFRVKFTLPEDNDSITVRNIIINRDIPFQFSLLRMGVFLALILLGYGIVHSTLLRRPCHQEKLFVRASAAVVTAVCCLGCVSLVWADTNRPIKEIFERESGNQITRELVDAFEAGQVSLEAPVDPGLLAMENPYDWSARSADNVSAQWDHVFYNGKYYSYYGIAPVVTLFLPYHLLTGHYFPTQFAVLLYGLIGVVFLTLTYLAYLRRFQRTLPCGMALGGLIVMQASSGIWYVVARTLFYEISIASGFACVAVGAYFLMTSNILSRGRISCPKLGLASFFLALAVLCRPTLAVYCIAAVVMILLALPRAGKHPGVQLAAGKQNAKRIAYLAWGAVPMLLLAGVQLWYNYARFDSPLDFGIQYSLTINDFTRSQFHMGFVFIGLYNYLLAVPKFTWTFPFFFTEFTTLHINGYYFHDTGNTAGIIWLALPVLCYLLAGKALKRLNRRDRIRWSVIIGLTCVLMPLVIICSIWESGYAIRYTADFSWPILIGALSIGFYLYRHTKNETWRKVARLCMGVAVPAALVLNFAHVYTFKFPSWVALDHFGVFHNLAELFTIF